MPTIVNSRKHRLRAHGVRFEPGANTVDDAKWAELKQDPTVDGWIKSGWLGDKDLVAAKPAPKAAPAPAAPPAPEPARKSEAPKAAPAASTPAPTKSTKADKPKG